MRYLAIDLGSTFIKGAVLDLERCRVGPSMQVPTPGRLSGMGALRYEISPEAICDGIGAVLEQLLDRAPDAQGLMMCTQMHGMVLVNERGECRSNAITWQDQRAAAARPSCREALTHVDWVADRLGSDLRMRLGNELRPGIPIATLACLAMEGGLEDERLTVVSLPDYVLSKLSGKPAVVDETNAAAYGLFDVQQGRWSLEALEAVGLDKLQLPQVVTEAGEKANPYPVFFRGKELRCTVPVGDHQCALLGSLLEMDEVSVNVSTGSQVSVLADRFHSGDFQVRPYFDGLYLHTVTHIPAGRSLNVLMNLLTELAERSGSSIVNSWELVQQAVNEVDVTDLKVDLSFFQSGHRAAGGAITGIREGNLGAGHLFRAAFESMAADYKECAHLLPDFERRCRIVFSGGIAQKVPVLRKMVEKSTQLSGRLSPASDDALHGLLLLGLCANGLAEDTEDAIRLVAETGG